MAGTISMAGLASGMDVSGMIDGLVKANSAQLNAIQSRITANKSASSAISDVGSLLSKLKSAVDGLSDSSLAQGFAASSSDTALQTSVTGVASGGSYEVEVKSLAKEFRAYSNPLESATTTINQAGVMVIQVGEGTPTDVVIASHDTLDSIAKKINEAGIGVKASTFNDGSQVRLQIRGVDSGAGNEVTITGLDLGVNAENNMKQQAQSAHLIVDGFDVYSKTNQVVGAIPGVTISASKETSSPAIIEVKSDPTSIKTKLQAVVSAYNSVVGKVQSLSGYGSTKASNQMLAGDSTLRQLTSKMSSTLMTVVSTGTNYGTLNSVGVSLTRDGTLTLDESKLTKALATNAEAVTQVLAGTSSGDGVMDVMSHLVDTFNRAGDGMLVNKRATLEANAKRMQDRVDNEQSRLDNYRAQLEKQFQAMDDAMTSANSTSAYLTKLSGG